VTRLFPYAVAVLELGACVMYAIDGNLRMTLLWGGYALAAFMLAAL
jgi:hypothetical protein